MLTKSMTPEERLQYCQAVIQEQEESGLSVSEFCRSRGIPKPRYYRYRHRILEEAKGNEEGGAYKVPELTVGEPKSKQMIVKVGGVRVLIEEGTDWEVAEKILRTLQSTC